MGYNTFDYYGFVGLIKALERGAKEGIDHIEEQEVYEAYYLGIQDALSLLLIELGEGRDHRKRTPEIMLTLILSHCNKETMDEVLDQGYEVELADRHLSAVVEPYAIDEGYDKALEVFKAGGDYGGAYLSYDEEVDMFFTYY